MRLATLIRLLHAAHEIGAGRGRGINGDARYAQEWARREGNAAQRGEDIGALLAAFAMRGGDESVID